MLHHAVRASKRTLLIRASSPEPANTWSGSPFTTALQVAAARAWTRTAVGSPRNVSNPASVTLEEEDTARTRKRIPSVLPDSDSGSRSNRRRVPPFAVRSSPSAWVDDDPLVDLGEPSSKAITQPSIPPTALARRPARSIPLESYVQHVRHQPLHSPAHCHHNSPGTTEFRSRTPIRGPSRHLPYSQGLAGLPDSTTSLDLLNNLDKWRRRPPKPIITSFRQESLPTPINNPPTMNYETLHAYHARFPEFQTHKSFRVLAEVAIKEAKFGAVKCLWVEMDRKGMLGDWDSLEDGGVSLWAIWVRWMVWQGKWAEAWKTAQRWRVKMAKLSASILASDGLPHAMWIEFLGDAHKSIDRSSSKGYGLRQRSFPTDLDPPNVRGSVEGGELSLGERHQLLMRQPPHRNHSQMTNVRPRTIYALARARLQLGDREWSMDLIRDWFERMGSEKAKTDTKGHRACLRLLNLYIALAFPLRNGRRTAGSGVPKGLAAVYEIEAVVKRLTKLNPRVKPNSVTLHLLLRHLRATAKCADNGVWLVNRYRRLYGDGVYDGQVRLRLASLAVKQKRPAVFWKALMPAPTSTSFKWGGVTLARRRARLLRERDSWLIPKAKARTGR